MPATKPAKIQNRDQQMGSALRSVYQKTVDEVVPDDLLDLLGKLD
ncbi:NepR family anti-sigma factor [Sphingomonas sp. OK281]|nr:NepR family anti-sigma factor [Sphingomonas sp. OK281]